MDYSPYEIPLLPYLALSTVGISLWICSFCCCLWGTSTVHSTYFSFFLFWGNMPSNSSRTWEFYWNFFMFDSIYSIDFFPALPSSSPLNEYEDDYTFFTSSLIQIWKMMLALIPLWIRVNSCPYCLRTTWNLQMFSACSLISSYFVF